MAARPTWKGFLKISLVNIPVRVFPATDAAATISFNQLHAECQTRIQQKRWCPSCQREVPMSEIAKGYEFEKGRYVVMNEEDVAKVRPESTRVIDLRGRTTLRQLIRLVHHAHGAVSAISALMHLSAAVPSRAGLPDPRPCVVIAGGREPQHWVAYPQQQFLHTIGALSCCAHGGCWKNRTVPLFDGQDVPEAMCEQPVGVLPRCLDLITAGDVVRRIELYYEGGALVRLWLPIADR